MFNVSDNPHSTPGYIYHQQSPEYESPDVQVEIKNGL